MADARTVDKEYDVDMFSLNEQSVRSLALTKRTELLA